MIYLVVCPVYCACGIVNQVHSAHRYKHDAQTMVDVAKEKEAVKTFIVERESVRNLDKILAGMQRYDV